MATNAYRQKKTYKTARQQKTSQQKLTNETSGIKGGARFG